MAGWTDVIETRDIREASRRGNSYVADTGKVFIRPTEALRVTLENPINSRVNFVMDSISFGLQAETVIVMHDDAIEHQIFVGRSTLERIIFGESSKLDVWDNDGIESKAKPVIHFESGTTGGVEIRSAFVNGIRVKGESGKGISYVYSSFDHGTSASFIDVITPTKNFPKDTKKVINQSLGSKKKSPAIFKADSGGVLLGDDLVTIPIARGKTEASLVGFTMHPGTILGFRLEAPIVTEVSLSISWWEEQSQD